MNFDNIKQLMDSENMDDQKIPKNIKELKQSKMPIQRIRQTMKREIVTQLIIIVMFMSVPSIKEMYPIAKSTYYIMMFITSLITLGYLVKMMWFLKQTSNLSQQSKTVIVNFIFDLRLVLEVYKTAIIAGSLLLPISLTAFVFGMVKDKENIFKDLFLFNFSNTILIPCLIGYVISAILIYIITVKWSNKLYGVHLKKLDHILEQLEA